MRRAIYIVAVLALAGAFVGLGVSARSRAGSRGRARGADAAPSTRLPAPRRPLSAETASSETSALSADPTTTSVDATTKALFNEARGELTRAAKVCLLRAPREAIQPGYPNETVQQMMVTYHLEVHGGTAAAADLTIEDSTLEDEELAGCISNAIAGVQWQTGAADQELQVRHPISVGDLLRRDPGPPPEHMRSPRPTAPPPAELWSPPATRTSAG